jgi:hypothetical protein
VVFLDSNNLREKSVLAEHVAASDNFVILLSRGALERPWILLELVTAYTLGIKIHPVILEGGAHTATFQRAPHE